MLHSLRNHATARLPSQPETLMELDDTRGTQFHGFSRGYPIMRIASFFLPPLAASGILIGIFSNAAPEKSINLTSTRAPRVRQDHSSAGRLQGAKGVEERLFGVSRPRATRNKAASDFYDGGWIARGGNLPSKAVHAALNTYKNSYKIFPRKFNRTVRESISRSGICFEISSVISDEIFSSLLPLVFRE